MCAAWRPIAIGGGLVTGVPLEPFSTDPDHVWVRNPVEIVLTDRQERSLLDVGLMPLSSVPNSEELVFGAVRSLQVPQRYQGANADAADANARLSTQINSILCASRFAHYAEDDGPPHGGLVQDRGRDRALPAGLADAVRQRQRGGERRQSGALSAGRRQGHCATKCQAGRAASVA